MTPAPAFLVDTMTDSYYCEHCDHPVSYHTEGRGCSMPVVKGTTMPKGRNDNWDQCETCVCTWVPDYVIKEQIA